MDHHVSELVRSLPGKVFRPESQQYTESVDSYFSAQESQIKPACVVRPGTTADVVSAISLLIKANQLQGIGSVKFAVRSGGHACFAGSANVADGVTIDLRDMNLIEVIQDSTQLCVGAGALWGQVYRALDPLGLAVPGGRHSQVGVGGLTLGGGLSHFSGHVGLVCDNVLEYEVVLASGSIVRATPTAPECSDLFYALRGGSNNFGIVTRFTFRTFPQGHLWGGTLIHPIETQTQQLQAFYDFCGYSYDPSASLIHSFGMSSERGSGFVNSIVYTKPEHEPAVVKPFTEIQPMYQNTVRELSLTALTLEQDAFNENGLCQIMIATTYYLHLPLLHGTYNLWQDSCDSVRHCTGIVWSMTLQPITPTIIAHSPFLQEAIPNLVSNSNKTVVVAQLTGTWKHSEDTAAVEATALKLIDSIDSEARAFGMDTGYIYLNYAHAGQNVFGEGQRKERLREISKKYDPEGIFQRAVPGGFKLF
ncbi:MAG: hypothetical protein L6R35_001355 [Caloplaca aegaea]|nr:MAG: hypothetical protein L6R35_001355 [Caloplaca aegaea]